MSRNGHGSFTRQRRIPRQRALPPQKTSRRKSPAYLPADTRHKKNVFPANTRLHKSTKHKPRRQPSFGSRLVECLALAFTAILGVMLILGKSTELFAKWQFTTNTLPFAVGISLWVCIGSSCLLLWLKLRNGFLCYLTVLPAILATGIAFFSLWFVLHDGYGAVFQHFRGLLSNKQQAARITLEHQVYAAYRRHDSALLLTLIQRSEPFRASIEEAAQAFDLDVNVLQGVASTESSFVPRNSRDGGHGLFQITAVSSDLLNRVSQRLAVSKLDVNNPRHNAFIAAAVLQQYLKDMHGDLFLGLLAYNIGPRNGGLNFIMQQYGAHDFITIQPYLQQLPRDYPIRVLSYALAFRLWQRGGKLPPYEEGDNASYIQRQGIPGLSLIF